MSFPTFARPEDFRAWLVANHASETELIVRFWKKGTSKPSMTWPESVREALCFGWIDGVRRTLDEEAYTIRFTPRKKSSHWSAVNIRYAEELIASGRMQPAGLAAYELRSADRTAQASYERRETASFSPGQKREFRANAAAWEFFQGQAPWYRRQSVFWVVSAKKPETRARRLAQLIEVSAAGRRR